MKHWLHEASGLSDYDYEQITGHSLLDGPVREVYSPWLDLNHIPRYQNQIPKIKMGSSDDAEAH